MLKKKRKEKLKAETTNTCKYMVLHAPRPIVDHWTRYETIKFDCKTQIKSHYYRSVVHV